MQQYKCHTNKSFARMSVQ